MLSQIKPQAPLLVVPIRPCLIFMFNVLSALPGFRPRLSQEILCIAKLMTANCSADCPTQHMRRICSMAHISNTCNVPVALDMEMEMDSHGGLEVTIRQTESKKKLPNNFVKQTPECS